MDSFESCCKNLIKQPNFWLKLLIGVLVAAIPIVNILAFGYLGGAIRESGAQDDFILPHWNLSAQRLKQSLLTGISELVILLLFLGGPVIVGYVTGLGLFWVSHSLRLLLAYCGVIIGAPTAVYAMLYVVNINELASVRIVGTMFWRTIRTWKHVVIPAFLFLCLMVLSIQLLPTITLGGPIFFGLVFIIAFMRSLKIVH
ncbi:MAG: hypothetical protein LBF94_00510 [Puniceicoccales bacterium]|nr:hypothetical protein [Puniceicoccales bacterium]